MASIHLRNIEMDYPIFTRAARVPQGSRSKSGMGAVKLDKNRMRGVTALQGISFDLGEGDRLAVIGRNGSGKSTLLRLIAGIYAPTTGDLLVNGEISGMFQMGLGMRATATGYRNIVLQGLVAGWKKKDLPKLIADVEEFTQLGHYLNLPVNTYSQGMAMRLNFAITTAIRPEILIMDEWIGAGDAQFQKRARKRLKEVMKGAGILVLASHNQNLLKTNCNKAIWLEGGKQMAFGSLEDVIAKRDAFMQPSPA